MLDVSNTRPGTSTELPVYSLAGAVEEGVALIHIPEGGLGKVQPSTGGANTNIFAGVALGYYTLPTQGVRVEEITVPSGAPYTVTLKAAPLAPSTGMLVKHNATVYTYDAAADATGEYAVADKVITFNSADANKKVVVTYRYTLSLQEALALTGDGVPGAVAPAAVTQTIGVIQKGVVYTDKFDTNDDWAAADIADIKAGANGFFQRGGTGAAVRGYVVHVPSADKPFLGLYIDA